MIIQVKAEAVNMPCDQYAEILNIKTQGDVVSFEIKLLGALTECEIKPWDIVGVKLSDHICWDCGGVNWCFCLDDGSLHPMDGDPICECGRLAYDDAKRSNHGRQNYRRRN